MKRAALVLAACCLVLGGCDGDDDDDDDRLPTAPAEAPVPTEGPANPQPPTSAPAGNSAPTLSLRLSPKVTTGAAPFDLHARMCESSDPDNDNLNFKYLWGDGSREYHEHNAPCAITHRYTRAGRYRAIFCTDDGWSDHEVCDHVIVTVQ